MLEICYYKLVVFSLAQHVPKTIVEPKRERLRDCDGSLNLKLIVVLSVWHNTSLKQQLSEIEDDYEPIVTLEICNYKLVLSLAQQISKTTIDPKWGRLYIYEFVLHAVDEFENGST